jgi:lipopolysaccharide/colanic/teichoic acid biosynthesis glycosyltransferase
MDLLVAIACLIFLGPVMILIALAILIESGRPIFFKQERLGQDGHPFTVYKFRSMWQDAEKRLHEVQEINAIKDGPIFKSKEDPRITRVGRYLRRGSMDELPQLFNVLLGSMSLVGPRPPLETEVFQYEPWQIGRLAVKPGMTGLWQVSGRSNLGFVQMMQLDLEYVEHWSFLGDVMLLIRTPIAVLTARGAY